MLPYVKTRDILVAVPAIIWYTYVFGISVIEEAFP